VVNVVSEARRQQGRQVQQAAFAFMGDVQANGRGFPVEEVSPDSLHGAVARWVSSGHAISFGLSGDGGAFGVHLIAAGEKRSKWFGHVAELEDFLSTVPGPSGVPVEGGSARAK
jgi:hypothetical protein